MRRREGRREGGERGEEKKTTLVKLGQNDTFAERRPTQFYRSGALLLFSFFPKYSGMSTTYYICVELLLIDFIRCESQENERIRVSAVSWRWVCLARFAAIRL